MLFLFSRFEISWLKLFIKIYIFQLTVEVFFLVHAAVTSSKEKKKPNQKETRKEQLSHI